MYIPEDVGGRLQEDDAGLRFEGLAHLRVEAEEVAREGGGCEVGHGGGCGGVFEHVEYAADEVLIVGLAGVFDGVGEGVEFLGGGDGRVAAHAGTFVG